jgi:hypothetical protein
LIGVNVEPVLDIVGGVVVLLLFTGIHNAWDVDLYTATYNASASAPTATSPAPAEPVSSQQDMASRATGN